MRPFLMMAGCLVALACPLSAPAQDARLAVAEVKTIGLELDGLLEAGNLEAYRRHLDRGCRIVTANGTVYSRDQFIAELRRANLDFVSVRSDSIGVQASGATVVLTSRTRLEFYQGGNLSIQVARITRVFSLQDGRWLMVSSHSTPLQG